MLLVPLAVDMHAALITELNTNITVSLDAAGHAQMLGCNERATERCMTCNAQQLLTRRTIMADMLALSALGRDGCYSNPALQCTCCCQHHIKYCVPQGLQLLIADLNARTSAPAHLKAASPTARTHTSAQLFNVLVHMYARTRAPCWKCTTPQL